MKPISNPNLNKSSVCRFSISLLAVASLAVAQEQPHPWRSANDPAPASQPASSLSSQQDPSLQGSVQADQQPNFPTESSQAQANPAQPADPQGTVNQGAVNNAPQDQNPAPGYPPPAPGAQAGPYAGPYNAPPYNGQAPGGNYAPNYAPVNNVPPHLTIKPGTYVTVRMNQWLSSDRNQQGDTFTATLDQPLVVDGFVVAQRGQTVYGRVSEAQKAGRVEGTSRLGVQLTQLSLVDGDQAPVQSQMIDRKGPTSVGRDAAAIGGTTAVGAAIGAGVDWGRGAAIGAGAGAAAGILGVLLTRGRPTVIYPESVLTFQITAPVDVSTDHAPQAFQYVNSQQNYAQGRISNGPMGGPGPGYGYPPAGYAAPAPYYPAYAYGYPYYGYPYYGGFSLFVGRGYGYYGPRFYGGYRGFRR